MNQDQNARQARRAGGRRRVRAVTAWVTGGAAVGALALGVGYAQADGTSSTSTSTDTSSTTSSDSSSDTQSDSGWTAPGSDDSGSAAHGSTGGS